MSEKSNNNPTAFCSRFHDKMVRIVTYTVVLMMLLLTGCGGGKKDYSNIEMNPNIAIPGYESLDFTAGKKKQSVNFYNPEENTCYFLISLVLKADDGTERGKASGDDETKETEKSTGTSVKEEITGANELEEVLWTSELIEPGEEIKSIKLDKELESGDYPAILKYECFSLKDKTPLNGSNMELMIKVR